jgi:hypothetical protein
VGRKYDPHERRQAQRHGRERGCRVYVPGEELERAGWPLDGPAPYYRVWGSARGSLLVRLYREG